MRPTRFPTSSVNQILLSGPALKWNEALPDGMVATAISPLVLIRPTMPLAPATHKLPSGPAVMSKGIMGKVSWLTLPEGVMRPSTESPRVNQIFPSAPSAMPIVLS